jgi:uncharacterized protein
MVDLIRYDLLVQDAMRGVVRRVLGDVAATGELPGEHHFTISFKTDAPGVKISRRLAEQWPQELTIILQHQFYDLIVDDAGFSVKLSFRGVSETLYVPFDAITVFSDPAAQFGVKFNIEDDREETSEPARREPPKSVKSTSAPAKLELAAPARKETETDADGAKGAGDKIVSIDAFRKKH